MTDAEFWDKTAEKYARSPIGNMEAYEYTLERTRSYLGAQDQVLEIGSGTGTTALALANAVGKITATDLSPAMTTIGQRKATEAGVGNAAFVAASVDDLPPGPFDVAMSFNLLHLLRDLDGALAQIASRVKPGGLFISKTICLSGRGMPWAMRALLLGLPVLQLLGRAPFVNRLGIADLEAAITRAGFDIVETGNYPDKPARRFIVARRRS